MGLKCRCRTRRGSVVCSFIIFVSNPPSFLSLFLVLFPVCKGNFDLTIVMENSNQVGDVQFEKVKTFAKQLVDAFDVRDGGTQVSVVSYGSRPIVHTRLDSFRGPELNNRAVIDEIDRIPFLRETDVSTSSALSAVLNTVYGDGNGAREDTNQVTLPLS